jgi:putative ABC transport system permease protein
MWLHYLKMTFRAMARQRFLSAMNLLGLAVGLASVILIFVHVNSELGYDSWLPRQERLYRVDTVETVPGQEPNAIALAPGPLRDALPRSFPQIEAVSRAYVAPLAVLRDGRPFAEDVLVADPDFFRLIALPFRSGDPGRALAEPTGVVLSERAARKYLGTADAVGRRLTIAAPKPRDFVVAAVFETLPNQSHLRFDVVIPHSGYFPLAGPEASEIPDSWGGAYFHTYARLRPGADLAAIERGLPAFVDRSLPQWLTGLLKSAPHDFYRFRFVAFRDVHFDGAPIGAMKPPASRTTIVALSLVAFLILVIAAINFANLSAARSTLRAREVALRKTVGARGRQILVQFMVEAICVVTVAALLAVAASEVALPWLAGLIGLEPGAALPGDPALWAMLAAAVAATALASGLYPSVVAARIRPAALFNRGGARLAGGRLRSVLVVLQFAISIALIATTAVILLQTRFARDRDLGFDPSGMLIVRAPEGPEGAALAAAFRDEVARQPDVAAASLSSAVPSDPSEDNVSIDRPGSVKPVQLGYHKVDSRFFPTYGVKPLAGRAGTVPGSAPDESRSVFPAVVNEAALAPLGLAGPEQAVGELLRSGGKSYAIVGVVPDLHFRSLHRPVRPEIYRIDDLPGSAVSIRYRTPDLRGFLAAIDSVWSRRAPGRAAEREFLDEALQAQYSAEQAQAALLGLFAAVAILLSCLGLVAMAAFTVESRTREIALRKVLGARSRDIFRLLLWQFLRPVVAANLIAWPAAYLVARKWLGQFAYRIDIPVSAFLLAGLAAALAAAAAVALNVLKVARAKPAAALQYE